MVRDSQGRFSSATSSAPDDAPAGAPEPVPPIPDDVAIVARVRTYRFSTAADFRRGPILQLAGSLWVWALTTAIEHGWIPAGTTLPGQLRGVWPDANAESTTLVQEPDQLQPWPGGYLTTTIGQALRIDKLDGQALHAALAGQELDPGLRMVLAAFDHNDLFLQ